MIDVRIGDQAFRLTVVEARKLRDKLSLALLEHEPVSPTTPKYLVAGHYSDRTPLWWEGAGTRDVLPASLPPKAEDE
jgi:hypothetical protein